MERHQHIPRSPAPVCRVLSLPASLLIALFMASATDRAMAQEPAPPVSDRVMEGWRVFVQKQCIHCHAVWGLGGEVGPDLGRSGRRQTTGGQLAGIMWNHVPKMYSHMRRKRLEYPSLSREEMGDLFSFLLFVQHLDEPGDPVAGRLALNDKGCASCHSLGTGVDQVAPDLRRWADYINPIVWAQKMWEHAPVMEKAMEEADMAWPKLADDDLVDIIAYVRSVGGREAKMYLEPGSAKNGARRFAERKCHTCHSPNAAGRDLATVDLPQSLAALATRMWNHSPQMTRVMEAKGVERSPLSAQEMSDIIAYIISLRSRDRGGSPERGQAVFESKQCSQCHGDTGSEAGTAPGLQVLVASGSPVPLAHAMWNHGVTMMDRMSEAGTTWPMFQPAEIVDLIAYLKSLEPEEAKPIEVKPTVDPKAAPVEVKPVIDSSAPAASLPPKEVPPSIAPTVAERAREGTNHEAGQATERPTNAQFVGVKRCKKCHVKQWKSWQDTKMAKAIELLEPGVRATEKLSRGLDAQKDYRTDAQCLKCHTTGFGAPGGYGVPPVGDDRAVAQLAGVGCESCHGPGSEFTKIHKDIQGSRRPYTRAELYEAGQFEVTARVCAGCHDGQAACIAPGYEFDFEDRKEQGTHKHYDLKLRGP